MPYLSLCPDIALWYRTNVPDDDLTRLPNKQTILMLHPVYLSSDHLEAQFLDPFLNEHYNLVAFDFLACGRTRCPTDVSKAAAIHDAWVDAALIAFFCRAFDLPPIHIFAVQGNSIAAGIGFAILWPERCLSLTLCSVIAPPNYAEFKANHAPLFHQWAEAPDLETLEAVLAGLFHALFNQGDSMAATEEERDDIIAYWQKQYSPARITNLFGMMHYVTATPLSEAELARIALPVLIIHPDASVFPVDLAERFAAAIPNATGDTLSGGPKLRIVPGPDSSAVLKSTAGAVNAVFVAFLTTQQHDPVSTNQPPVLPWSRDPRCMRRALGLSSRLAHRPDMIADRSSNNVYSFSRVTGAIGREREEAYIKPWLTAQAVGFDAIRPDGTPIRKFSERHAQQRSAPRTDIAVLVHVTSASEEDESDRIYHTARQDGYASSSGNSDSDWL